MKLTAVVWQIFELEAQPFSGNGNAVIRNRGWRTTIAKDKQLFSKWIASSSYFIDRNGRNILRTRNRARLQNEFVPLLSHLHYILKRSKDFIYSVWNLSWIIYQRKKKYQLWGALRTLVTQPMLQRQPNPTELRSMDHYHQIFCRFQKCKRKVPPPSPLSNDFEKSWVFSLFF